MLNNYLSEKDKERFSKICDEVFAGEKAQNGVGTLSEKSLHAVVKNFVEENREFHERKLGRFVADVFDGSSVFEIQTRSFYKMKSKLCEFLETMPVTVVYPLIRNKRLIRVDKKNGEFGKPGKSSKKGDIHMFFREMYGLADIILNPGIKFRVLLIDVDEYRLIRSEKDRGGEKGDIVPREIIADYRFDCFEDFAEVIPNDLPETFTAEQYAGAAKARKEDAACEIRVLAKLGILEEAGREGHSKLWHLR